MSDVPAIYRALFYALIVDACLSLLLAGSVCCGVPVSLAEGEELGAVVMMGVVAVAFGVGTALEVGVATVVRKGRGGPLALVVAILGLWRACVCGAIPIVPVVLAAIAIGSDQTRARTDGAPSTMV